MNFKKKKVELILIILSVICLNSCTKRIEHVEPYGYTWYEVTKKGLHGAEDENGNVIVPCKFTSIELDTFKIAVPYGAKVKANDFYWKWRVIKYPDTLNLKTWQYNYLDMPKYSMSVNENDYRTYKKEYFGKQYQFKDYYTEVFDNKFNVIFRGYYHESFDNSYNNNSFNWKYGGDITNQMFFLMKRRDKKELLSPQGNVIISSERGYNDIIAYQIQGKSFYLAVLDDRIYAILDNRGKEIFRMDDSNNDYIISNYLSEWSAYKKKSNTYNGYYVISEPWGKLLVYDDEKGFGCFERSYKKVNPYSKDKQWREYNQFEKDREYPDIIWSGIIIPDYSTSFVVVPTKEFYQAPILDLTKITSCPFCNGKGMKCRYCRKGKEKDEYRK